MSTRALFRIHDFRTAPHPAPHTVPAPSSNVDILRQQRPVAHQFLAFRQFSVKAPLAVLISSCCRSSAVGFLATGLARLDGFLEASWPSATRLPGLDGTSVIRILLGAIGRLGVSIWVKMEVGYADDYSCAPSEGCASASSCASGEGRASDSSCAFGEGCASGSSYAPGEGYAWLSRNGTTLLPEVRLVSRCAWPTPCS